MSCVPTAVGTEPAHFDLSLARNQTAKGHDATADWLVLKLQELISLSYQVKGLHLDSDISSKNILENSIPREL